MVERGRAGDMGNTRFRIAVTATLAVFALSSCVTTSGKSSASALYISALQGGIVARSGVELSDSQTQRALEAEYRALEAAPGGQPVAWNGNDISGQVVAAAPYQVGQQNCRQYTHKLRVKGSETEVRGAACRNPNGTWTPLT
ncbi:surface antigen [Ciceribacter lividus]|uniref:Surface antigen n=2 Tax=Rhizobiaceae TaxID=82115 RepID=A0A6I7HIJ5_9HYPH|nr:surface antigen [Ciceribacter lividus]